MSASTGAILSFFSRVPGRSLAGGLAGAVLWLGGLSTSARAQATGSLDTGFDPGSGFAGHVPYVGANSLVLQPDGKLLAAGLFTSDDGVKRPGLTRLNADGSVDTTFNPDAAVAGAAPSGARVQLVDTFVLQPDGKILATVLSSIRTDVTILSVWTLIRLNADGSRDTSFTARKKSYGRPCIALLPDGKIVMSFGKVVYFDGYFDVVSHQIVYDGKLHANTGPADRLIRLNADGRRDPGFASGRIADDTIFALAVQPDGKVLLGGGFKEIAGSHAGRFARLSADGSRDAAFRAEAVNADDPAYVFPMFLVVQPDGRILTGGQFTAVDGVARKGFARLNADGSLDKGFDPNPGLVGQPGSNTDGAASAAVQPDGKVVVVGSFETADGVARHGVARLDADGSLDASFDPRQGTDFGASSVVVQPDGKIVIGGSFTEYDGVPRAGIARLR